MTIIEMRDKRTKLLATMDGFLDTHRDGKGLLSAEDDATYAGMEKELAAITNEIKRMERREAIDAELSNCACSGEMEIGVYFIPSSKTATFPEFADPPNWLCQASRTLDGSLIVPGCSSTPEGAAPLAKNLAPYSSQAIAMPMAFFAIAMGL